MGMFDEVRLASGETEQVKCWDQVLGIYCEGSEVPEIDDYRTYCVYLEENRVFVRVTNCRIMSVHEVTPYSGFPVFDSWGRRKENSEIPHQDSSLEERVSALEERLDDLKRRG